MAEPPENDSIRKPLRSLAAMEAAGELPLKTQAELIKISIA